MGWQARRPAIVEGKQPGTDDGRGAIIASMGTRLTGVGGNPTGAIAEGTGAPIVPTGLGIAGGGAMGRFALRNTVGVRGNSPAESCLADGIDEGNSLSSSRLIPASRASCGTKPGSEAWLSVKRRVPPVKGSSAVWILPPSNRCLSCSLITSPNSAGVNPRGARGRPKVWNPAERTDPASALRIGAI